MRKNFIAAGMAIALTLTLVGCSQDSSQETAVPDSTNSINTTKPTTATKPAEQNNFQETVLVDNEDILFKITAIKNDPVLGYTLKAQIENRTDKDLMIALDNTSVNGYMCDPFFAATVTAGMRANKDISFDADSFRTIGITDVTDVSFQLRVYDSNNISAEKLFEEYLVVYPLGKDAFKEYPRAEQEDDIVLFDDERCTMIVTGFSSGSIWGYSTNVYLVNKTDKTLMFSVGDAAINGFMCDPFFATTVAPGKQSITSINWTKDALKENDITQVEKISLPVRVYEAEDWLADDLINETFTLNP